MIILSLTFCQFFLGEKLSVVNWLKDPAICTLFLSGGCSKASSCLLAHDTYGKPYVWQYKDDGQSMWENFHPNLNNSVEKCFEDPAINNFNGR